jgi:hypothetical protein
MKVKKAQEAQKVKGLSFFGFGKTLKTSNIYAFLIGYGDF